MLKVPLEDFIDSVIRGGITAIQVRNKGSSDKKLYDVCKTVREQILGRDILFIVNDRVDIAAFVSAGGVHVGASDVPPDLIRQHFPSMLLGYSCNNMSDVNAAISCKADYIGVGPANYTNTKENLRQVLTVDEIGKLIDAASMPGVAIGGIDEENISNLRGLGLSGVAVSSSLCASYNPYEKALKLRQMCEKL